MDPLFNQTAKRLSFSIGSQTYTAEPFDKVEPFMWDTRHRSECGLVGIPVSTRDPAEEREAFHAPSEEGAQEGDGGETKPPEGEGDPDGSGDPDDPEGTSAVEADEPPQGDEAEAGQGGDLGESSDGPTEPAEPSSDDPELVSTFECEICGESFTSKRGLGVHTSRSHGD